MTAIQSQPLTAEAFKHFGEVIDCRGDPVMINQGRCRRYHDLARLAADGDGARLGISLFSTALARWPVICPMFERHPLGSQTFIPMSPDPFLVITADDNQGKPGCPHAFLTAPGQGVNFAPNVWHGVLTALEGPGLFAVVDRIGGGQNLEEHWLDVPVSVSQARRAPQ